MCWGDGGGVGKCWDVGEVGGVGKCWERCEKVYWGVGGCGKVLGEVWKGKRWERCGGCLEVLGKVWESVLGCRESKERYVGKC